jgi:hypothetical protein
MGGGSRQAVMTMHPAEATSTGTFVIQLFNPNSPTPNQPIGWLGRDSANWAILATDQAKRLVLEAYVNGDKTYYKIPDEARYMSVSNNAYIGFYGWSGASTFHQEGEYLISDHNGQALSFYSPENGYLYCYDDYTRLKVKFVST